MTDQTRKKNYHIILVHGACHGAWCWYKLATLLKSYGHRVTTPDLAASGIDTRRVEDLSSFDDYSKPLYDIMDSVSTNEERVVLVGHSLGGLNIAKAMEKYHDKIHVAAFMPDCTHGIKYLIDQYNKQEMSRYDQMDNQVFFVGENEAKVANSMLFGPKFSASRIYQICPPEDITLATTLLRPMPSRLMEFQENITSCLKRSMDQ